MKEFKTNQYKWSIGHAPRGFGHWWFKTAERFYQTTGTYTDAKKEVLKQMKEKNDKSSSIVVCS